MTRTLKIILIPVDEVPRIGHRRSLSEEWNKVFESISPGMAAEILTRKDASPIRAVLKRRQKKGLYLNYFVIQRKEKIYVINPKEPEEE